MVGTRRVLRDLPGEVAVDGPLLEGLVRWLDAHRASSTLARKLAIGDELLARLFTRPGADTPDFGAWVRSGDRHETYRALADHPNCPWSRSYLGRCVRLSVQHRQLPPSIAGRIDLERAELLVPVPMPEKRLFAQRALAEEWTRARLDDEVGDWLRGHRTSRPGRPRTSRVSKAISTLTREVRRAVDLPLDDFPTRPERRAELANQIDGAIAQLDTLVRRLRGGGG